MIKKTKKQRNKKVKKQNKLYEPQPFPGYYDNPLHKTYGLAEKGSLIKVCHIEFEQEKTGRGERGEYVENRPKHFLKLSILAKSRDQEPGRIGKNNVWRERRRKEIQRVITERVSGFNKPP